MEWIALLTDNVFDFTQRNYVIPCPSFIRILRFTEEEMHFSIFLGLDSKSMRTKRKKKNSKTWTRHIESYCLPFHLHTRRSHTSTSVLLTINERSSQWRPKKKNWVEGHYTKHEQRIRTQNTHTHRAGSYSQNNWPNYCREWNTCAEPHISILSIGQFGVLCVCADHRWRCVCIRLNVSPSILVSYCHLFYFLVSALMGLCHC